MAAAAPPRPAGTIEPTIRPNAAEHVGTTSIQAGMTVPPPPTEHPAGPGSSDVVPAADDGARVSTMATSQPAQAQNGDRNGQCTAPQLRRFIKSRPYVPMHELRRRFSINCDDDDVTPVRINPGWIYVGLPNHEGHLLGDLLRTGEIGYELSLDPRTPIVIGVYPMRPIPRT